MNEVFLDTETTGLSFKDGHKIVEIACIETKDLISTGKVFHKLINPKRNVPEEAYNVHGFTEQFLSDKEIFEKISEEFLDFIKDKKIIIHNASFDLGFLNGELDAIKKDSIDSKLVIDSLEIARNKFPGTSNSLDNALLDCELLREVYINLLDAKEPRFNLSLNNSENTVFVNKSYNKQIVDITKSELDKHKEFLKKELKKNFY